MTENQKIATVLLIAGATVLAAGTILKLENDYNKLVGEYNRLLANSRIRARVFQEILPQLPDDYTLSDQSMFDIQASIIFEENNL